MIVIVALTVGLVWWLVAWSLLGVGAFDSFLVTVALVVGAAAYMLVKPFIDQMMGREAAPEEERGAGGF
jgi:uncharacterized membrane protein